MCFEIGQLTIAMPVVISFPAGTGTGCNAETRRERRASRTELQPAPHETQFSRRTQQPKPPRLLERQLTSDLSKTLATRCLRLASLKLLTSQDLDLQQFEPVLNRVSQALSYIIHTLSAPQRIPRGLSSTTVLICVGPSSHSLLLVIRRWRGQA